MSKQTDTWSQVAKNLRAAPNRYAVLGEEDSRDRELRDGTPGRDDDETETPSATPSASPTARNYTNAPTSTPTEMEEIDVGEWCNDEKFIESCVAGNITAPPEYVSALECRANVTNSSSLFGYGAFVVTVAKAAICSAVNQTHDLLCYNATNYTTNNFQAEQCFNITGNFSDITNSTNATITPFSGDTGPDFWEQHGLKIIAGGVAAVGFLCCAAVCAKVCCHTPVEIDRDTHGDGAIGPEGVELGKGSRYLQSNQVAPYTGR